MGERLLLCLILCLALVSEAAAQLPSGYEIVNITDDPQEDRFPRLNNCGEVVYHKESPDGRLAIFLYDNGKTTQVSTDGDYNTVPDINDDGTIVWSRWNEGTPKQIVVLADGLITQLTDGPADDWPPRINNLQHVVWSRWYGDGCGDARADIFSYDGTTIEQLTEDPHTKQHASSNEQYDVVWGWTNFCVTPWETAIMLWIDGVTRQLTTGQDQVQHPTINDVGQVSWRASTGIDVWEDGVTEPLTEWGSGPNMNNRGEILFHRWHDDVELTLVWLYRDGTFYQLTDGPFSATGRDINEDGEVVWRTRLAPEHWDVWVMRRLRRGDVDVDSDVDIDDFAGFPECMTGPVDTDRLCECRFFDIDHDRDVDLSDFANLQNLFTGEN